MQLVRPVIAAHPRRFGRGPVRAIAIDCPRPPLTDDLKLFGGTFLAGFLFVSILIG